MREYLNHRHRTVVLLGARLNWILHFGMPPRFDPNVRVIQMDISAEEIGTNVPVEVAVTLTLAAQSTSRW